MLRSSDRNRIGAKFLLFPAFCKTFSTLTRRKEATNIPDEINEEEEATAAHNRFVIRSIVIDVKVCFNELVFSRRHS